MLGVEKRGLGELCLADRHCESLLVCYIGNESPDSAGKLLCSCLLFMLMFVVLQLQMEYASPQCWLLD